MEADAARPGARRSIIQNLPYWTVHTAALVGAVFVGWSWRAAAWLVGGYAIRMFGITAGYHRYFAHRSFKTSRAFQFVLAVLGMTASQQGPLWWAGVHRRHHQHADDPEDPHSPRQRGFLWAHVRWLLSGRYKATDYARVRDLAKYPELRFLNGHDAAFVIASALAILIIGGPVALVWGFFVAIVATWHVTFSVNSLSHLWGSRRYATRDDSRNNPLIAVLAFGEGWHNNHHHYRRSARQGFYWWEMDISYYALKVLESLGLVWDVEGVPREVRDDVQAIGVNGSSPADRAPHPRETHANRSAARS